MTLSARTPTGADTAGFVGEIWAQLTRDAAEKKLVTWDSTDHRWTVGKGKGDTVNIGVINNVTATEVVVGTKAASLDIATGTKLQLVMEQWYEAPIDVDSMTMAQSQIDWPAKARAKGEYAVRVQVDSSVAALFSALNSSGTGVQGTDGAEVSDDLLISIKELLDEADADDDERFLIVDPSVIADMLKYDKFIAAAYVSDKPTENGQIASNHPIYGCSVRKTNNLTAATTGAYCVMMQRQAIASALQIEIPWDKEFKELHQTRFQFEALWGVKEIRDDFGIPFYSRKA
jgi:hypothetical protein